MMETICVLYFIVPRKVHLGDNNASVAPEACFSGLWSFLFILHPVDEFLCQHKPENGSTASYRDTSTIQLLSMILFKFGWKKKKKIPEVIWEIKRIRIYRVLVFGLYTQLSSAMCSADGNTVTLLSSCWKQCAHPHGPWYERQVHPVWFPVARPCSSHTWPHANTEVEA